MGLKEVFTKTKAAYERKCKSKEQEAKTEKTTKEKVMKVQSAAENLEKATHERCDKTLASSEKSDKWEVSHWSAELDSLKAQCAEAQKSEEKDQKAFTFAVCEAAHNEIASVAASIEESGDDEEL